jgi:hypothetical protein
VKIILESIAFSGEPKHDSTIAVTIEKEGEVSKTYPVEKVFIKVSERGYRTVTLEVQE